MNKVPGVDLDLPDGVREFDDADATRKLVYDNALAAVKAKFPISDGKTRLELADARYDGPMDFGYERQKRAMLTGASLHTPIKGTWRLVDEETGAELGSKPDSVVMRVPYITDRGTALRGGIDTAVVSQQRLLPGVYTRVRKSGETEAHFNVAPGTGRSFRVWMEPETGAFKMSIGQANVPLAQTLKLLGVDDKRLAKEWGDQVFDANLKEDNKLLEKLYARCVPPSARVDGASNDEMKAAVRDSFSKSKLDHSVVRRTLGLENVASPTPEAILRATHRVMAVHRGDEAPDDRDAPEFSEVHSVEDFLKERVEKDAGHAIRKLFHKVSRHRNLDRVGFAPLDPHVHTFMLESGMAQNPEEPSLINVFDQTRRIVRMGEGGLPSAQAVTDEARDVQPGLLGFIDPLAGPESELVGTDVRVPFRTFKGADRKLHAEFTDARTGKSVIKSVSDMSGKVIAFPGQEKDKVVHAVKDNKIIETDRKDVDYIVPSMAHMYSHGINLTPFVTSMMPTRAFYAAKYWSQFMPLAEGEAPLVSTQVPGSKMSFHEYYGRKTGTLASPVAGVVTRVSDANVTVTDEKGRKHVMELARNLPMNRMTAYTHTAVVQTGDKVGKGDMLAHSNFTTPKGELALGRNLKAAFLPFKGHSFDDAAVISESAAKKLAVEQLYGFEKEHRNGVTVSRSRFISAFPKKFTQEQLAKLDENGVAKPGMELHKGDPIVLATSPRSLSAEDARLGNLHKVLRNATRDESEVWEHDEPGIVTDVALTARGAAAYVKTTSPTKIGDKITSSLASKGVISRVVPDDEMPRDAKTGEPYEIAFNPMAVPSRVAPNHLDEARLAKIAKHTGKPYVLPQHPPPEGWNQFTKNELEKHGISDSEDMIDPKTGKLIKDVGDGYMYIHAYHHLAKKKLCLREDAEYETVDGWKLGRDITANDLVRTLDLVTGETHWRHPLHVRKYEQDGEPLYLFKSEDGAQELVVTKNHRLVLNGEIFELFQKEDTDAC